MQYSELVEGQRFRLGKGKMVYTKLKDGKCSYISKRNTKNVRTEKVAIVEFAAHQQVVLTKPKKLQILRIEHEDGYGIFYEGASYRAHALYNMEEFRDLYDRHVKFPNPWEEKLFNNLDDYPSYYCAFRNISQVQEWVAKDEIERLLKLNYSIYLLEVTTFREGKHQVVFKKDSIVTKINVNNLFV